MLSKVEDLEDLVLSNIEGAVNGCIVGPLLGLDKGFAVDKVLGEVEG